MAVLILAARGVLHYDHFLFANTGDDSEDPATLEYLSDHALPYAQRHGIPLHTVEKRLRDGTVDTVLGRIERTAASEVIPVRSSAGGRPLGRSCTVDFKIKVLGKWLTEHGATPDDKATVGVGISLDEIARASRRAEPHEVIEYPLLDLGLRRTDCQRVIREEGLPVPPKSSCYFCPFHTLDVWTDMRRDRPEVFARAVEVERKIDAKVAHKGEHRYLTRFGAPLDEVVPTGADLLPFADDGDGDCMSGVCAT